MKKFALLCFGLLTTLAFSQPALEAAKPSKIGSATAGRAPDFPIWGSIILVAVLFAVMKWVGPKWLSFAGSRMRPGLDSSLKIEETANLAQGALYVVKVRGKSLLLGATAQSITCLADLSETEAVEMKEPAFFELVDRAVIEEIVEEPEEEPVRPTKDSESARKRLDQLIGRNG